MLSQVWRHLPDEVIEDFLIDHDPEKVREVIKGQVVLHDLAQGPEGVLFVSHLVQEVCHDEIHSLEVANFGVSLDEGDKNVAQLQVHLCLGFRITHAWVRPHHVQLNLLEVWVRIELSRAVLQVLIVARVCIDLCEGSTCFQPDQSVHFLLPIHHLGQLLEEGSIVKELLQPVPVSLAQNYDSFRLQLLLNRQEFVEFLVPDSTIIACLRHL